MGPTWFAFESDTGERGLVFVAAGRVVAASDDDRLVHYYATQWIGKNWGEFAAVMKEKFGMAATALPNG